MPDVEVQKTEFRRIDAAWRSQAGAVAEECYTANLESVIRLEWSGRLTSVQAVSNEVRSHQREVDVSQRLPKPYEKDNRLWLGDVSISCRGVESGIVETE